MTRLTVAGRLTAAEGRRIRGWLVPFGRPGQTNLGRVIVNPGGVEVPEDTGTLFASLDHLDGRDSVAEFATVEERPEGLWAEWEVPETHGGDRLLAEFRAGTRTGISVELEPVRIRDGVATGRLIGCAFPIRPAFPDARLVAALAEDTPAEDLEEAAQVLQVARTLYYSTGGESVWEDLTDEDRAAYVEAARAAVAALPGDTPDPPPEDEGAGPLAAADASPSTPEAAGVEDNNNSEGRTMSNATAPAGLLAGAAPAAPPAAPPAPSGGRLLAADSPLTDAIRLFAEMSVNPNARGRLLAALVDLIPANTVDRNQPAWIGEIWQGNAYVRRIVPLLTQLPLTDLSVKGWKWNVKPAMAKYAGNKAAIPSTAVSTSPYTDDAQRFAGGNDIDIKYRHFADVAFFTAYFQAMSESYAKLTDAYAVEEMKAAATTTAVGTVPTGVPAGWSAVVDLALEVIDVGTPSFALVEKTVYREMFLTGQDKFLEFLNAQMGLEEGTLLNFRIIPVTSTAVGTAASTIGLDRGEIIVGTKAAVKFRELGDTPIRVDALNIANGGLDEGVFGYAMCSVEDARGLRKVDLTTDV